MVESDSSLVERAQSGDAQAYDILVERYHEKMLYLAVDLTKNFEDAQDVAQEAFIKAYQKLDQFRGNAKFSTWLYRITSNLAIDHYRKRKRKREDSMDDSYKQLPGKDKSESLITGNESSLATGRRNAKIRKAIEDLSDQQKTAVVLKFFHGKTSIEIGEIMECSDATVRTHIYRAMKNLKHLLHDLKLDE